MHVYKLGSKSFLFLFWQNGDVKATGESEPVLMKKKKAKNPFSFISAKRRSRSSMKSRTSSQISKDSEPDLEEPTGELCANESPLSCRRMYYILPLYLFDLFVCNRVQCCTTYIHLLLTVIAIQQQ